jgi:hypothetical protein
LSLLVAIATLGIANGLVHPKAAAAFHALNGRINGLRQLLFWAFVNRSLVCITFKDSKVYVGQVRSLPPETEQDDGFIVLLPWASGYRDEKKSLKLTTFYEQQYIAIQKAIASTQHPDTDSNAEKAQQEDTTETTARRPTSITALRENSEAEALAQQEIQRFLKVLPISEVSQAGLFDPKYFTQFVLAEAKDAEPQR